MKNILPDQVNFPTCNTYLVLPSGEYECITDVILFTDSPDGRTLRPTQHIHCFMMPNYADIFSIIANQVMVKRQKLPLITRKYREKDKLFGRKRNFQNYRNYAYSAIKAHLYRKYIQLTTAILLMVFKSQSDIFVSIQLKIVITRGIKWRCNTTVLCYEEQRQIK